MVRDVSVPETWGFVLMGVSVGLVGLVGKRMGGGRENWREREGSGETGRGREILTVIPLVHPLMAIGNATLPEIVLSLIVTGPWRRYGSSKLHIYVPTAIPRLKNFLPVM